MQSLRLSSFLAPMVGGVRSWVILLFRETGTARSKTGELDETISLDLKTMSMDGAGVREASTTTATRQAFAQPELRRILVAVPPSRSESAGGHGATTGRQLCSFGGQPKTCERWSPYINADDGSKPSLCTAMTKADVSTKVGQSSRRWSGHTASTPTTSCPRYCFMASPSPPRLLSIL